MKLNAMTFISDIYSSRNVLHQLIVQQLILRYRRTVLGYFWTLVNPLLMMSVMAIVFSTLFKVDLKTFAIFLFAGMIPWGFFSSVVGQSGGAFINNEGLIKKIYLPKIIFPLSIACALLIDCLLSFIALLIIILLIGGTLSWAMLFLPISFALLFVFAVGCSLIVSVATVFFRDLQYVIVVALQGLFFLTPILYKQDLLLGKVSWLVKLNPVTPFIALFRTSIIDSALPTAELFLHATAIAFATMGLGLFIFLRQEKKIVFRL
jgi:ABC-type polysaccharide/polyol phosphate export permease